MIINWHIGMHGFQLGVRGEQLLAGALGEGAPGAHQVVSHGVDQGSSPGVDTGHVPSCHKGPQLLPCQPYRWIVALQVRREQRKPLWICYCELRLHMRCPARSPHALPWGPVGRWSAGSGLRTRSGIFLDPGRLKCEPTGALTDIYGIPAQSSRFPIQVRPAPIVLPVAASRRHVDQPLHRSTISLQLRWCITGLVRSYSPNG